MFSKKPPPITTTKPEQMHVWIPYACYKIWSLQRNFRLEALCGWRKYSPLPSPNCGVLLCVEAHLVHVMETSALILLIIFFCFQIPISKLLCCPALSSLSSFAWQKHVMFVVNVLDYYLVLVLNYLVPRYYDWFCVTDSSVLCVSCQLSVHLIIKPEKAIWVDHSYFQGKSISRWLTWFKFNKKIFSIVWFT